jgi:hypothetical protein
MMVYLTIQSVCPLLPYCEYNMANDVVLPPKRSHVVCLSSLFSIDNIFKLHPWQYGVFLNAAAITTWIDLCELGCIKGLLAMVYFCLFLWRKI